MTIINSINYLKAQNFYALTKIINILLYNNPYHTKNIQHYLWNEFAEKNTPFLVLFCNFIYNQHQKQNFSNILFTTRDCVFLKQLFNILYPQIESETFFSSRALYLFPTDDYVSYCKEKLTPSAAVIDFQGTGQSFKKLISELNLDPWYVLVNWNSRDKLPYSKTYLHDYNKKIIIRQKNFFDDAIEKLNIDINGTYFDYYCGQAISYKYEYDKNIIRPLHECFELFVSIIDSYLEELKKYSWNIEFNNWMDLYYTNNSLSFMNKIQWQHTHFVYEAETINKIRNQYRNAKIS